MAFLDETGVARLWEKAKEFFALKSHTHSSYANKNVFGVVKVGDTSISATTTRDTLTISNGSNITLVPSETNKKVAIHATNTKNTAGSTDTSEKIFLIGATSQDANPKTYSHDTAYVDTDGCLYSGGEKVVTSIPVDSAFSTTSTNPVQNQVITNWLNNNHAWKVRSVAFSALNTNISVSEFGTANEILIVVKAGTTAYQYEFTIIPKLFGTGNLLGGYSIGTQYTGVCELYYDVPNKVIQIKNLRVGNNAHTSGTVFVFYR